MVTGRIINRGQDLHSAKRRSRSANGVLNVITFGWGKKSGNFTGRGGAGMTQLYDAMPN